MKRTRDGCKERPACGALLTRRCTQSPLGNSRGFCIGARSSQALSAHSPSKLALSARPGGLDGRCLSSSGCRDRSEWGEGSSPPASWPPRTPVPPAKNRGRCGGIRGRSEPDLAVHALLHLLQCNRRQTRPHRLPSPRLQSFGLR